MKPIRFVLLFILILALPSIVHAQDAEYRLDLRRDFGYGAGSNVRGNFTNRIFGDTENIASVTYYIDDQVMGVVNEPPFEFKYHTSTYPSGWHDMTAVVVTKDGQEFTTPVVTVNLLTAEGQNEGMQRIFIPLGIILGIVALIGIAGQVAFMRRGGPPAAGAPRNYGFKGGTICPRCGRAYAIHFFSINLIGGVVDRCDYCGKVAFVRARSRAELDAAVAAEAEAVRTGESSIPGLQTEMTEEERARKLLDDSRYLE
jgi:hypothetical protein